MPSPSKAPRYALAFTTFVAILYTQPIAAQPTPTPLTTAAVTVPLSGGDAAFGLRYVSTFERYRSFGETPIAPWRAGNDAVEQRGGWRAYLKEAQAPEAASPAPARTTVPVAPAVATNPHATHGAKP